MELATSTDSLSAIDVKWNVSRASLEDSSTANPENFMNVPRHVEGRNVSVIAQCTAKLKQSVLPMENFIKMLVEPTVMHKT